MNITFEKIEPAKRNRVLNAAFKEFATKGYEDASTNRIAKNAEIGKGTLFYHFDNKEKLFIYLIDKSIEIMNEMYFQKIDFEEQDIFERLIQFSKIKQNVYYKLKSSFDFIGHVLLNVDSYEKIYGNLKEKQIQIEQGVHDVLTKNIDLSKFREDIEAEKALKLIYWSIEGYREDLAKQLRAIDFTQIVQEDLQPYYEEFYSYMNILKKVYYKAEYYEER